MSEQVSVYESKMKKTLASLESELMTIRAGRANPNILNKLTVDYYGTPTPIQQVVFFIPGGSYDRDPAMGRRHDQRD